MNIPEFLTYGGSMIQKLRRSIAFCVAILVTMFTLGFVKVNRSGISTTTKLTGDNASSVTRTIDGDG